MGSSKNYTDYMSKEDLRQTVEIILPCETHLVLTGDRYVIEQVLKHINGMRIKYYEDDDDSEDYEVEV